MFTMHDTYNSREVNLHTHSFYCGHGSGQLVDFVEEAKRGAIALLGFSEHAPLPNNLYSRSRMDYSEIGTYLDECRSLQASEEELQVLVGFECDNLEEWNNYYIDLKESNQVDYLCGGVHFVEGTYVPNLTKNKNFLYDYCDDYVDMLGRGIYDYGVHPDLFCAFYRDWDSDAIAVSAIIESAQEHRTPLEINGNGLRKGKVKTPKGKALSLSPQRVFGEMVSTYDVQVIANSDAHHPYGFYQQREEVYSLPKSATLTLVILPLMGSQLR